MKTFHEWLKDHDPEMSEGLVSGLKRVYDIGRTAASVGMLAMMPPATDLARQNQYAQNMTYRQEFRRRDQADAGKAVRRGEALAQPAPFMMKKKMRGR